MFKNREYALFFDVGYLLIQDFVLNISPPIFYMLKTGQTRKGTFCFVTGTEMIAFLVSYFRENSYVQKYSLYFEIPEVIYTLS